MEQKPYASTMPRTGKKAWVEIQNHVKPRAKEVDSHRKLDLEVP